MCKWVKEEQRLTNPISVAAVIWDNFFNEQSVGNKPGLWLPSCVYMCVCVGLTAAH